MHIKNKKYTAKTKNIKFKKNITRKYKKNNTHKYKKNNNTIKYAKNILKKIMKIPKKQKIFQKGGYQNVSQGYTLNDNITPQTSSLANPMPFTPYNTCITSTGKKNETNFL